MIRHILFFCIATLGFSLHADAQITPPRILSTDIDPVAQLEEQLTNRLRATTDSQRAYIRVVIQKTRTNELETRLVLAVQQYALRRNPHYPFPFFERALTFEAAKRNVALPTVDHVQRTSVPFRG